jgi:cleavage stimulation factor subunit 3
MVRLSSEPADSRYYAASYHLQAGRLDQAAEYLKAGVEACPKRCGTCRTSWCSFLLTFAQADLEEERKQFNVSQAAYESLLANVDSDIEELKEKIAVEVQVVKGSEIPDNHADGPAVARLREEREARGTGLAEARGKEVDELMVACSMVWIMYMRFARRSEVSEGLVPLIIGNQSGSGGFRQGQKIGQPHLAYVRGVR